MKWLRILGVLMVGVSVLCSSACGGKDPKGLPAKGQPAKGGDQITVAFISNNAFDFWKIAQKGTEKAKEELAAKGFNIEVEFKMPQRGGTSEEQQQIIKDLITNGVKGIAISPNAAKHMTGFFRDEVSPHVHLLTVDSDVPDASVRRCYLGTHNYRAGRAAGALVKKAAPKGGKIAIFVGKSDVQNAVERRQGVLDELAGKKTKNDEMEDTTPFGAQDLKVGDYILLETRTDNGNRETCETLARQLLLINKDLVCLVGLWEYNPPALLAAVEASEAKPAIVGFDENLKTLEGIRTKQIFGTVVQNPFEFGRQSVTILAELARGNDKVLQERKDLDATRSIFIPHRIITEENVKPFEAEIRKLKGL